MLLVVRNAWTPFALALTPLHGFDAVAPAPSVKRMLLAFWWTLPAGLLPGWGVSAEASAAWFAAPAVALTVAFARGTAEPAAWPAEQGAVERSWVASADAPVLRAVAAAWRAVGLGQVDAPAVAVRPGAVVPDETRLLLPGPVQMQLAYAAAALGPHAYWPQAQCWPPGWMPVELSVAQLRVDSGVADSGVSVPMAALFQPAGTVFSSAVWRLVPGVLEAS